MGSTVTAFTKIKMANPDKKTILIEQAFEDIKEICIKYQNDSGASNSEIKSLLMEIANVWGKEVKNNFGFR